MSGGSESLISSSCSLIISLSLAFSFRTCKKGMEGRKEWDGGVSFVSDEKRRKEGRVIKEGCKIDVNGMREAIIEGGKGN